ncbi:shikimate dehydrogenase [Chloroflexota bacterium]
MIDSSTCVCCLIGDPIEHSLSPLIHNAGYQSLGLNFIYLSFPVRDIERAISGIRGLGIRGASVTIPHKVSALEYMDKIDETARDIGAINTIVNNDGTLAGYNTDARAAIKALEETVILRGKRAVIIGSGGAAKAIAAGLKNEGVSLVVLNRTAEKAEKLAGQVGADDFGGLGKMALLASVDILVNATPLGMLPAVDESVIPGEFLHIGLTVFDAVYNPKETRLLVEARQKGCNIVYGYKMFLYQAALQFELFTGQPAPLSVMESALTEALE